MAGKKRNACWEEFAFYQCPCFQLMIICIHTVCRERWKPSISSQFYSVFPIKPPLFTFSVSTQSQLSARQLRYSPLVRIWETPLWTKCENKCLGFFSINQCGGFLVPRAPQVIGYRCEKPGVEVSSSSVLTPDEKVRRQWGDETPLMLWFAASCWQDSAQALSMMLVCPTRCS